MSQKPSEDRESKQSEWSMVLKDAKDNPWEMAIGLTIKF